LPTTSTLHPTPPARHPQHRHLCCRQSVPTVVHVGAWVCACHPPLTPLTGVLSRGCSLSLVEGIHPHRYWLGAKSAHSLAGREVCSLTG